MGKTESFAAGKNRGADNAPLMVSEHIHVLEQFPLYRSLNSFRWHGNPILQKGKPGEWDDALIRDPMIFYDATAPAEERFKLYYSGQSSCDGQMHIGLAYGRSLEKLARYAGNPVVRMSENWDSEPANHNPYVIRVPGTKSFEMLYTAYGKQGGGFCYSTARVVSSDGKKWTGKKQVFKKFSVGQQTYYPQKPVLHYNAEEGRYYLIFSGSLKSSKHEKNEGFIGLATSHDGENYSFEKVVIPQAIACSIYDTHGLVPMFGWYFLLVTHDTAHAHDGEGGEGYPMRWLVSKDFINWYGSPKRVWDTSPEDGIVYSHVTPMVTEAGMAYLVYDYGKPNRFGLAKIPLTGKPYNIIVSKSSLHPGENMRLKDCYPAVCLEREVQELAVTVECAYRKNASLPVRIHIFTSYDGDKWDTEEQKDIHGKPVFGDMPLGQGTTVRATRNIRIGARFVKVTAENPDPVRSVDDIKIIVTFG